jgi:microcystin-dependent protein
MKRLWLLASLVAGCFGSWPAQAGPQPYIGEVETFAFTYCPTGWLPLNGQLMSIATYSVLYNLLGTTYGGDGVTTFALPLAKPVLTLNQGTQLIQCIAYLGVYPSQN